MFLVPTRNFWYFQFFSEFTKYFSEFNKIDKYVNRMCFSTLYKKNGLTEKSVHKKLSSKNVTGPNLCNSIVPYLSLRVNFSSS